MAQSVDKQGDHALRIAGFVVVGGHAQAADRTQKIIGINVRADFAGPSCGIEQGAKGGSQALLEVRAQAVEGRVARVQGWCQPALGSDEGRVTLQPSRKRLSGAVVGRQAHRGICAGVDFATKDGGNEVRTLRKVPVERANTDPGPFRNVSHGGVHARGCEDLHGRLEQCVEVAPCVGACRPLRPAALLRPNRL